MPELGGILGTADAAIASGNQESKGLCEVLIRILLLTQMQQEFDILLAAEYVQWLPSVPVLLPVAEVRDLSKQFSHHVRSSRFNCEVPR